MLRVHRATRCAPGTPTVRSAPGTRSGRPARSCWSCSRSRCPLPDHDRQQRPRARRRRLRRRAAAASSRGPRTMRPLTTAAPRDSLPVNAARRDPRTRRARRRRARSTCWSSGSAPPAPGVALDAASRGLSVAAIDAHDLAFGTSRWSSKLIHGGLRYLASGQLDVARESAVERGVLMARTAPHLVRALPFVHAADTAGLAAARRRPGPRRHPGRRPAARCRPAPRAPRCRARAGCPPSRRCGWRRRCARTGCAAGCCPGTASSPTTRGWSPPIARTAAAHGARDPDPVPARCPCGGDGAQRARRAHRAGVRRSQARAVVNATGVWAGRPRRRTYGCGPRAAPISCCGPRASAACPPGLHIPVPGASGRFVAGPAAGATAGSTSA